MNLEIPSVEPAKRKTPGKGGSEARSEPRFRLPYRPEPKKDETPKIEEAGLKPMHEQEAYDKEALIRGLGAFLGKGELRQGESRVLEAAWQNKVTRILYQRPQMRPDDLESPIRRGVQEKSILPRTSIGPELDKIFAGIRNNLEAVKSLEADFRASRRSKTDLQTIGINDVLDASHMIDLVDIRHHDDPEGKTIDKVSFVQVKSKGKEKLDISGIHQAHQQYYESIISRAEGLIREYKSEAAEDVSSGAYFERQMSESGEQLDKEEFISGFFSDFLFEFVSSAERKLDDDKVRAMLAGSGSRIKFGLVKLFFSSSQAFPAFRRWALGEKGMNVSREEWDSIRPMYDALKNWADSSPLSYEELAEVRPGWRPPDSLLSSSRFESIIYQDGVVVSRRPLIPRPGSSSEKTLTYR